MAAPFTSVRFCPRCDNPFSGKGASPAEAVENAMTLVREHLVRAQGAEMDEGLHDYALEQWDDMSSEGS